MLDLVGCEVILFLNLAINFGGNSENLYSPSNTNSVNLHVFVRYRVISIFKPTRTGKCFILELCRRRLLLGQSAAV
jgi:hypothetical protein